MNAARLLARVDDRGGVLLVAGNELEAVRLLRENPGRFTDYVTPHSADRVRGLRVREVFITASVWTFPTSATAGMWAAVAPTLATSLPTVWEERPR